MRYFNFNIDKEIKIKTSKSSGKGGQHVNKTESKVEVCFAVANSKILSSEVREMLLYKLQNKMNDGQLCVVCSEDRSQIRNKELAIQKLYQLLEKALVPVKKRKPTKPTASSIEKKKKQKMMKSEMKQTRKKFKF